MKYENSYYSGDESVVIRFSCPSLSSLSWCVKLYSLVLASLGLFISFLWVCFQLYVLFHTTSQELRVLRYFDIFLGIILIISMSCLLYGGYFHSQISITAFITTSLGVMITYWCLFTYFSYNNDDLPLYDDQVSISSHYHTSYIFYSGWFYWSPSHSALPAPPSPRPSAIQITGEGTRPANKK